MWRNRCKSSILAVRTQLQLHAASLLWGETLYANAREENSFPAPVATAIKGPCKIYTAVTCTHEPDFIDV